MIAAADMLSGYTPGMSSYARASMYRTILRLHEAQHRAKKRLRNEKRLARGYRPKHVRASV